jgi:hypothetical protein
LPIFVDVPDNISVTGISLTALALPIPTKPLSPLPIDLLQPSVVNILVSSGTFPTTIHEDLLVQWSKEAAMPQRTPHLYLNIDTPENPSSTNSHRHHRMETHVTESQSTSAQSRSIEENRPTYIHTWKKSHFDRAPSPATNIDQLRSVLAGTPRPPIDVPKIKINGENGATPVEPDTPGENEEGDVTMILDSLFGNQEWKEKNIDVDHGIRPPYAL